MSVTVSVFVLRFQCCIYVPRDHRSIREGEPRTATSTVTQLLWFDVFVSPEDRLYNPVQWAGRQNSQLLVQN